MTLTHAILICDYVGLAFDAQGRPDPSEVRAHIESRGGTFQDVALADRAALEPGKIHFFYLPALSSAEEILAATREGAYDAVIAAATIIPPEAVFPFGGVRIGAGTGNMQSMSWGGGDGRGGTAPLMNTPGFNSTATAQMVMKAILAVAPDLPVASLHERCVAGQFDTGRDLVGFPTAKLEGRRLAVLGYGNIGRAVARLGAAFGMEVVVAARSRHQRWIEAEGYLYAETPVEAAKDANILSVHVGLGRFDTISERFSNAGLVDGAVLGALAPGAMLINYDRGEVVDVAALEHALACRHVANAAIDADLFVDDRTGMPSGPLQPYLDLAGRYPSQIKLLPHAAADTDHPSRVAGACQAVDQIYEAIEHRLVINAIGDIPAGYRAGGRNGARGVERIDAAMLNEALDDALVGMLRDAARRQADAWDIIANAKVGDERRAAIAAAAPSLLLDLLGEVGTLKRLGLYGPFVDSL